MELKIKTLRGSCVLSDVTETMTVGDLQVLLHQQHKDDPLGVPLPEQQRLVFKQAVLPAGAALQHVGIANGDQLVLLVHRKLQLPPPAQTTPAPDAAAIRAAITDEARQRGVEHTLREERPPAPPARRNVLLTPELLGSVDGELLQLLEQALAGAGGNILQGLRLSGSGDGSQDQRGEEEEEAEEEEGEIPAPEPSGSHMAQLTDMGFSEALARKALQLTRDNVEHALDWLLQHSEEPGAADPPTQEQLRAVYGRRRRRAAGAAADAGTTAGAVPTEAVLSQLTEMGFDAVAARQALARVGPNLDLAVTLLLGQGLSAAMSGASSSGGGSAGEAAGAQGSGAAAATDDATAGGAAEAGAQGAGAAEAEAGHPDEGDGVAEQMEDDEDEEDYDEYEDAAEDDYVSEYEDTDIGEDDDEGPALPLHLEQALGTMGSMDLHELGTSDLEQLLQGGMAGPQGALLRLMEAPGLLQQMFAAVQEPAAAAAQQQQAPRQADGEQQQEGQQQERASEAQQQQQQEGGIEGSNAPRSS